MLSSSTRRSSVLVTPRSSSGLESLVGWRRPVRTGLVLFWHGCSLVPEVRPPECNSRNSRTRSLPSMPAREPSGPSCLLKLGSGLSCGWPSSLTSSAHSLESIRQNLKTKLPRLMPTLMEQLHSSESIRQNL